MTELFLPLPYLYIISYPTPQYQWTILPQGMLNSPTKCQYNVNQSLQKLCDAFPKFMITHYMDDINFAQLGAHFEVMIKQLLVFFKNMALWWSQKIRYAITFQYLGYKLQETQVLPQNLSIHRDKLKMLNNFKKNVGRH